MNIVGISSGYHDSACCLLQDGQVIAAAQEERFSRIKNDQAFPGAAFRYCLDEAGVTISDIDCIAFYEDSRLKLGRQLWMGMLPGVAVAWPGDDVPSEAVLNRAADDLLAARLPFVQGVRRDPQLLRIASRLQAAAGRTADLDVGSALGGPR